MRLDWKTRLIGDSHPPDIPPPAGESYGFRPREEFLPQPQRGKAVWIGTAAAAVCALTAVTLLWAVPVLRRELSAAGGVPGESTCGATTSVAISTTTAKINITIGFDALILDENGLVQPLSGPLNSQGYDKVLVAWPDRTPGFMKGAVVHIAYDGTVRETYPPQITALQVEAVRDNPTTYPAARAPYGTDCGEQSGKMTAEGTDTAFERFRACVQRKEDASCRITLTTTEGQPIYYYLEYRAEDEKPFTLTVDSRLDGYGSQTITTKTYACLVRIEDTADTHSWALSDDPEGKTNRMSLGIQIMNAS